MRPGEAHRLDWVDRARGVGIVLVVLGHASTSQLLHHFLFLFHMPLFFVLSGYLARPREPRVYAWRRAVALLLPYVAFLVLVTVLDLVVSQVDGVPAQVAGWGPLGSVERMMSGGTALIRVYGVFWFVTCLYFTGQLFNLASAVPRFSAWLLGAMALIGCVVSYRFHRPETPLGLMSVPMAFFFYWLGSRASGVRRVPLWVGVVGFVILVVSGHFAPEFNMKYSEFGSLPVNVIAAVAGALFVVSLAAVVPDDHWLGRALASFGRGALVIMFLHLLVTYHLAGRLPEWAVVVLAVLLPWLAYRTFERWALTRLLFLGKRAALDR